MPSSAWKKKGLRRPPTRPARVHRPHPCASARAICDDCHTHRVAKLADNFLSDSSSGVLATRRVGEAGSMSDDIHIRKPQQPVLAAAWFTKVADSGWL